MENKSRKIIHLDLDAFFCAVEEQRNPALRGKPFAVGGQPEQRGVVASCSYAARRHGIRSAMPMARAVQLCRDLIIVSQHRADYVAASRKVMTILREATPLVEQLSIDEAFLDVTEQPEYATVLAKRLQRRILDEVGLPCSLGVATNKLVAKIATDVGKAQARDRGQTDSPNAITVVRPGQEAAFLAPLPAQTLWGIGPKTAARLAAIDVHTIGDLVTIPENELAKLFGKNGHELAKRAKGIDTRAVVTARAAKSFSQETTYARDVRDEKVLLRTLQRQADQIARQLRRKELTATTIKIKLRWPDFTTLTRQTTLNQPTSDAALIAQLAERLFRKVWRPGKAVRLLGVGVSGLSSPPQQLSLWDQKEADRREE